MSELIKSMIGPKQGRMTCLMAVPSRHFLNPNATRLKLLLLGQNLVTKLIIVLSYNFI